MSADMFYLVPLAIVIFSEWLVGCASEEKPPSQSRLPEEKPSSPPPPIKPQDTFVGTKPLVLGMPEYVYRTPDNEKTKRLSAAGREVLQVFQGSIDAKKTFFGLTPQQQLRVDQTYQATSIHGLFSSMLALGKFFESERRPDVAIKIYKTLNEKLFPISDLVRTDAGVHLIALQKMTKAKTKVVQ
jgi:hypothetical protein